MLEVIFPVLVFCVYVTRFIFTLPLEMLPFRGKPTLEWMGQGVRASRTRSVICHAVITLGPPLLVSVCPPGSDVSFARRVESKGTASCLVFVLSNRSLVPFVSRELAGGNLCLVEYITFLFMESGRFGCEIDYAPRCVMPCSLVVEN